MSSKNKNVLTENVGVTRKKTTMMNTNVQTKCNAAGTRRSVRSGSFLNPDLVYVFCNDFEYHQLDNFIAFTIKVQNVVHSSIEFMQDDRFVHLKFNTKDGEQKHNYSFYIAFNMNNVKILSVNIETTEKNIVLKLMLNMFNDIEYFMVGPNKNVLEKRYLNYTPNNNNSEMELITPDYEVDVRYTDGKVSFILKPKESSRNSKLINKNKIAQKPKESFKKEAVTISKQTPISKTKPKESSKKEAVLDSKSTNKTNLSQKPVVNSEKNPREATQSKHLSVPKNLTKNTNNMKVMQGRRFRSMSASDVQSDDLLLKGILKQTSRYNRIIPDVSQLDETSLSKSCDEALYPESSSFDETETPQTSKSFEAPSLPECPKKRVTFCDNVKTYVFRENSSILGQQRKNQKRKIQKQRAQQRRYSEGDATDQIQARTSTNYGISSNDSTPRRSSPIADSDEDIFKFEM